MDLVAILQDFGFPVACAVGLAWCLKVSLSDRINALEKANAAFIEKVDELNRYIREEQAAMISESHVREKELVALIREARRPPGTAAIPEPTDDPMATDRVMAAVREKHDRVERAPGHGSRIRRSGVQDAVRGPQ
jgi:hypothetical protein